MRIKELFTVPDGATVTEKAFTKVLISSVCSILLCMGCLAGTTWAWFTAGIENTENEIHIAKITTDITIKNTVVNRNIDIDPEEGGYVLNAGSYDLEICLDNTASALDDLNRQQNDVYVAMTVTHNSETKNYFFTFAGKTGQTKLTKGLQISGGTAVIGFSVSWVKPASATAIDSETVVIGDIPTEYSAEASTEFAMLPSTQPSIETPTNPATESETSPTECTTTKTTTVASDDEALIYGKVVNPSVA